MGICDRVVRADFSNFDAAVSGGSTTPVPQSIGLLVPFRHELVDVSLSGRSLSSVDIQFLCRLRNLSKLNLCAANVPPGGLQRILSSCARIQDLEVLGASGVTDSELDFKGAASSMRNLALGQTDITNDGLAALVALQNLESLDLSDTRIDDLGIEKFTAGKHDSLAVLTLWRTGVTDEGVSLLRRLPGLRQVFLGNTRLTDSGAASLSDIKSLEVIYAQDTSLTDGALRCLATLPVLEVLVLSGAGLSDAGLRELESCKSLKYLSIESPHVTPQGIERLKAAIIGLEIR
jgi:hypothetical protein